MRTILSAALAAALAGCGPATAATRDFPVGPFDRISNATPFDVQVGVGGAPAVRAEGPETGLARLRVAVRDGTLTITMAPGAWTDRDQGRRRIEVSVPRLVAATVAGPGDMIVDAAQASAFTARVTGPGDLSIKRLAAASVTAELRGPGNLTLGGLGARTVTADLEGPGNLILTGRAEMAVLTLRGPGDLRAAGLTVRDAAVRLHGPGDLQVTATGVVRGDADGPGDITIRGGARCEISKRGPGDVRC